MKLRYYMLAGSIMALLALPGSAHALSWRAKKELITSEHDYDGSYDTCTESTITGSIAKLEAFAPRSGLIPMVQAEVVTEDGPVTVYIGPASFMNRDEMTLRPDDKIEVSGSMVTLHGKEVLLASSIKKGGYTLRLRQSDGTPVWHPSSDR